MIYRKGPLAPPKLLLRIALTAGAGAMLTASACSSSSAGSVAEPSDGAAPVCDDAGCGLVAEPDAADCLGFCVNGLVAYPDGAVADAFVDAGGKDSASADSSDLDTGNAPDACHMVCGAVILPPDGGDGSVPPSCFPVCGVVNGLAPSPHDP